jgi:hypothetical protein
MSSSPSPSPSSTSSSSLHHRLPNGDFFNPWPSAGTPHGFLDFFGLFFSGGWDSKRGAPPPESERVPIVPMDWEGIRNFHSCNNEEKKKLRATWLGHATFLVQMENCNILTG